VVGRRSFAMGVRMGIWGAGCNPKILLRRPIHCRTIGYLLDLVVTRNRAVRSELRPGHRIRVIG